MNTFTTKNRRGFSLVELLAVVLVLAVLAAVAVPLYTSQRTASAARACKANIAAIASSCAGYALRNGSYPATGLPALTTALVGSAEGLTAMPTCPLGTGSPYTWSLASNVGTITCPNAAAHATAWSGSVAGDYTKVLPAPAADSLP